MKILVISNYLTKAYRQLCLDGLKPKQHLWGGEELEAKGYHLDYVTYEGFSLKVLTHLWLLSFRYDNIFIPVSSYSKYLGILKKVGLLRPRLIVVLHHPPFDKILRYGKYDKILFLSKPHWQQLYVPGSSYYPWGCDIDFYKNNGLVKTDTPKDIAFISNGYTNRDNDTLVKAAIYSQKRLFYTAHQEINCNNNDKIQHCKTYFQTDLEILRVMYRYDVLVIPTFKTREMIGTIGLTSFMDAVGMHMPVIVASNSPISFLVKENKVGLVYETGDAKDLASKMQAISDKDVYLQMRKNMAIYSETIALTKVNKQLCSYF